MTTKGGARASDLRPATRVDNDVIFHGGYARTLTRAERLLLWLRIRTTVDATEPPAWYLDQWRARVSALSGESLRARRPPSRDARRGT
jgi:hypothetical protein